MASRNRGRQAVVKTDADEERAIWAQLRADAKRIDGYIAEHNKKWARIIEITEELDQQHANGEETSAALENELAKLSRENVKLCEDITTSLKSSDDNSILSSLDILRALRQSSESDHTSSTAANSGPPPPRAAAAAAAAATTTTKLTRNKHRKGGGGDASSVMSADNDALAAPDSPMAASPKVVVPGSSRLKASAANSRAGSVGVGREASVKVEDGADSGADVPTTSKRKGGAAASDLPLIKGAEVFYRTKKSAAAGSAAALAKDDQGEGILCTITDIGDTGSGTSGRSKWYEIIDVEPDEGATPYRAAQGQLVAIPPTNEGLPDPQLRKTVLAMYPGTTTFYRADVVALRGKDVGPGHVKLRFEDEDNENTELAVERRYVLLQ